MFEDIEEHIIPEVEIYYEVVALRKAYKELCEEIQEDYEYIKDVLYTELEDFEDSFERFRKSHPSMTLKNSQPMRNAYKALNDKRNQVERKLKRIADKLDNDLRNLHEKYNQVQTSWCEDYETASARKNFEIPTKRLNMMRLKKINRDVE